MVQLAKKDIPTPIVEQVSDYEQLVDASFKLPLSYVRTKRHPLLQSNGRSLAIGLLRCSNEEVHLFLTME